MGGFFRDSMVQYSLKSKFNLYRYLIGINLWPQCFKLFISILLSSENSLFQFTCQGYAHICKNAFRLRLRKGSIFVRVVLFKQNFELWFLWLGGWFRNGLFKWIWLLRLLDLDLNTQRIQSIGIKGRLNARLLSMDMAYRRFAFNNFSRCLNSFFESARFLFGGKAYRGLPFLFGGHWFIFCLNKWMFLS